MTKKTFTASISKEGKWYIAQCLEVDIATQGKTKDAALKNLQEALELHFENPKASIKPEVKEIKVNISVA